jgi:hypothetical protein
MVPPARGDRGIKWQNMEMEANWYKRADMIGDGEAYSIMSPFDRGRIRDKTLRKKAELLAEVVRHEIAAGRNIAHNVLDDLSPFILMANADEHYYTYGRRIGNAIRDLAFQKCRASYDTRHPDLVLAYNGSNWIRHISALHTLSMMFGGDTPACRMLHSQSGIEDDNLCISVRSFLREKAMEGADDTHWPIEISDKMKSNHMLGQYKECLVKEIFMPGTLEECMHVKDNTRGRFIEDMPLLDIKQPKRGEVSRADAFLLEMTQGHSWKNLSYSERTRLAHVYRNYIYRYAESPEENPFARWYIERVRSGKMPLISTLLAGPGLMYQMLESVRQLRTLQDRQWRTAVEDGESAPHAIVMRVWNYILDKLIEIGHLRNPNNFDTWLEKNEKLLRRI